MRNRTMAYLRNRFNIIGFVVLFSLFSYAVKAYAETPKDVMQSNVSRDRFVVSWTTTNAVQAQINYGTTPALGSTAYDVRGQASESTTHYVYVTGLSAGTVYYYDIVCDGVVYNNGGAHYTITTGPILSPAADSDIAYGQAFLDDGVTPAEGSIVYIKLRDNNDSGTTGESQLFSCMVDGNGYWYVDLKNIKNVSLDAYFEYSDGDNLVITAKGVNGGSASSTIDTAAAAPAPPITITLNAPPVLDWAGGPGYENDALDPESGSGSTEFTFKIKYTDLDGDQPQTHKVYIDRNGDGVYSAYDMSAEETGYASGVIYTYTTTIPYSQISQSHAYYFEFYDGLQNASGNITQAISQATAIHKPDVFQTLSLTIDHTDWQLLNIEPGAEYITSGLDKAILTNGGDGSQTYGLKITNQGGGGWMSSPDKNGSDVNTFVLSAVFGGDSDSGITADYFNETGNDDVILSDNSDNATSARFGSGRLSQDGSSVPVGGVRSLWFGLKAPSKDTTKGASHSIEITINAEAS